jgi:hypothetical protein
MSHPNVASHPLNPDDWATEPPTVIAPAPWQLLATALGNDDPTVVGAEPEPDLLELSRVRASSFATPTPLVGRSIIAETSLGWGAWAALATGAVSMAALIF